MSTVFTEMAATDEVIEMTDLSGNTVAAFYISEGSSAPDRLNSVMQFFNNYDHDPELYCLVAPNGSRFDGPFDDEGRIESYSELRSWFNSNK
jgi:hypothetical protein